MKLENLSTITLYGSTFFELKNEKQVEFFNRRALPIVTLQVGLYVGDEVKYFVEIGDYVHAVLPEIRLQEVDITYWAAEPPTLQIVVEGKELSNQQLESLSRVCKSYTLRTNKEGLLKIAIPLEED